MSLNIASWNVNGLRARLKKGYMGEFLLNQKEPIHILCLQETKLQPEQEEKSCKLPEYITKTYPHRYWSSNKGTTQRKGFSGTTIWCTRPPIKSEIPDFDEDVFIEQQEKQLQNLKLF